MGEFPAIRVGPPGGGAVASGGWHGAEVTVVGGTRLEGHGGALAVAVARRHGVEEMFTLSGGHVFPLYDGAVKADPPLRLVDVRHEQTARRCAWSTCGTSRRRCSRPRGRPSCGGDRGWPC